MKNIWGKKVKILAKDVNTEGKFEIKAKFRHAVKLFGFFAAIFP